MESNKVPIYGDIVESEATQVIKEIKDSKDESTEEDIKKDKK